MQSWSISKKSIIHESQNDDSQVTICQYGIERDSGHASQRKGYTHTLQHLHRWLVEERNQLKFTNDKSRTENNDKHEETGLVNKYTCYVIHVSTVKQNQCTGNKDYSSHLQNG